MSGEEEIIQTGAGRTHINLFWEEARLKLQGQGTVRTIFESDILSGLKPKSKTQPRRQEITEEERKRRTAKKRAARKARRRNRK